MALYVGGSPITPTQLATLQADLGIVVAEEITARLPSLVNTDDTIFLRGGVPHLAAASVIADYVGVSGGAQTLSPSRFNNSNTVYSHNLTGGAVVLTPSRLDNSQTFYAPTVALAGGSAEWLANGAAVSGSGTITINRPPGASSSNYITTVVWSTTGAGPATMGTPTGWSTGSDLTATNPAEGRAFRVFTAPGDVTELTFTSTGTLGAFSFLTNAPLRSGTGRIVEAADYSSPASGANRPNPAVTAVADDVVLAAYVQYDDGTGGQMTDPGSPQAGYTRRYHLNGTSAPYISLLSRSGVSAGSTGTISHDALGGFSGRFHFTGAYGA